MTICILCQDQPATRGLLRYRVCAACHRTYYRLKDAPKDATERAVLRSVRILRTVQALRHGIDQFAPTE